MKLTLLLADAAQPDSNGKVSCLGLGWTRTGLPQPPMAVILLVDVEVDEVQANEGAAHTLRASIQLFRDDGEAVMINTDDGQAAPFSFSAETGPMKVADLLTADVDVRVPIAISLGTGLLDAKGKYYFRASAVFGQFDATVDERFVVL